MADGHWGSRLPIGNFVCTKLIFAALRWRLVTCRLKNAIRRFVRPAKECVENDASTSEAFGLWLQKGYDKLNVGGGSKNLEGFVNIDFVFFPGVHRQVVANILDLSFVPSSSVSHVHSNHVIEHLTAEQLSRQLDEYYRVLKPDGCLSVRCPNGLGAAYGFWFGAVLEQDRAAFINSGFPADEDFGNPDDRWIDRDFYALAHWFYGNAGNIRNQHLNIITPTKIKDSLQQTGFRLVRITDPEAVNIAIVARKA